MLRTRQLADGDKAYVLSTWLREYGPSAKTHHDGPAHGWHADRDAKIKESLACGMRVIIAYDDAYPDVIIGFCAHGPGNLLHFLYVRHAMRRNGVATALWREAFRSVPSFAYSHYTSDLPLLFRDATMPITAKSTSYHLFPVRAERETKEATR